MKKFKLAHGSKRGVERTSADSANHSSAERSPLIIPSLSDSLVHPCTQWEEKLVSTHYDDLSCEERIELEKHLEECPSCSAIRRYDRIMDSLIRQLPFRDLPLSEIPLELPPQLKRLWEFEDMQKRMPQKEISGGLPSEVQQAQPLQEKEITTGEKGTQHIFQLKRVKPWITRYCIVILGMFALTVIFSMFFPHGLMLLVVSSMVILAAIGMIAAILVLSFICHPQRGKANAIQKRKKFQQTLRELVLL